jgi:hypothetical protein
MLNGHRNQIAKSDAGLAGSVLKRHNKVKQSIGDSVKLAMLPQALGATAMPQPKPGRPPKPADTTTVPGAVTSVASQLAPPETKA